MFIINIERLEGVELVLKALRESGCIASADLAAGIEKTLVHVDEDTEKITVGGKDPWTKPKPGLRLVQ